MKRKDTKRTEAIARNEKWAALSPAKQLEYLDSTAEVTKKQRAKIAAKMQP
jgi:hypothetical protein